MSYDYTELAAEARRLAGFGVPPPGQAGSPSASSEAEGEHSLVVRELARVVLHLLREHDDARAQVEHLRRGIEAYRDCPHGLPAHRGCQCDMCAWERENGQRSR